MEKRNIFEEMMPYLLFAVEMKKIREMSFELPPRELKNVPFIEEETNLELTIDTNISLEIRPSNLKSLFVEVKNDGVFTNKFIEKGTVIMGANYHKFHTTMNDAIFNLNFSSLNFEDFDESDEEVKTNFEFKIEGEHIEMFSLLLEIDNSEKYYQEWCKAKKSYYNVEILQECVNVVKITDKNYYEYYKAIKDLNPGDELLCLHGFLEWPLYLLETITNKTIVGFAQFINEIELEKDDRLCNKIKILHSILNEIEFSDLEINFDIFSEKDIFTIDRELYDKQMYNEPTINVGNKIEELYFKRWLEDLGKI